MSIFDPDFDPTPEARALFSLLNDRWNALARWGVVEKMPHQSATVEDWKAFRSAWIAEQKYYIPPGQTDPILVVTAISAEANALNSVELDAKTLGYDAPPPVKAIDATKASSGAQTAEQIDQAAKAAEKAARDAANVPLSLWASVPWYWKAGGAAALGLALIGAAKR